MRLHGLVLLVATASLAACAGPADPSAPETPLAYRVGSRIKQPDVAQPNTNYYHEQDLTYGPDYTLGRAVQYWPATPVPPPPEVPGQATGAYPE